MDAERDAVVEQIRGLFPKDADIKEEDRIDSVKDRRGVILWDGPLYVSTIQRRRRHKEALLMRNL